MPHFLRIFVNCQFYKFSRGLNSANFWYIYLLLSVYLSIYQHHLSSFQGSKRHKKKTKTNETIKSRDIHENSWKSLKFIPQKFCLFKMHASNRTKRLLHFVSGSLSVFLAGLDTFHVIGLFVYPLKIFPRR